MNPVFRWAGSKRQLIPCLLELAPKNYERYVEPFLGSGCLFFKLAPQVAVLSDCNADLMATYSAIAKSPKSVSHMLKSIPHTSDAYYLLRDVEPKELNEFQSAARFIFLMKSCFNGVYRTNRSGKFNTPYGGKVYSLPTEADLIEASRLLSSSSLLQCDYSVVVNDTKRGDFLYVDPPYPAMKFRGEYGYQFFSKEEMNRLSLSLESASKRGVKIMLSFSQSNWLDGLFGDWNIYELQARRSVSANVRFRKVVTELLLTNY